jgi:hypothetical protein
VRLRSRIVGAEQSAQNADIPRSCAPPQRHAKIFLRLPGGILGKALKLIVTRRNESVRRSARNPVDVTDILCNHEAFMQP